jgi:hypothetical protein
VGSGGPHVAAAALSHHVRHVVGVRAEEQVTVWVALCRLRLPARRVVAVV